MSVAFRPGSVPAQILDAFEKGIPADRKGPGRTFAEIIEATGLSSEEVIAAVRRMQHRGVIDGAVFENVTGKKTLYWPREHAQLETMPTHNWEKEKRP